MTACEVRFTSAYSQIKFKYFTIVNYSNKMLELREIVVQIHGYYIGTANSGDVS